MFWIPVGFVFLVIYLIKSTIEGVKISQVNIEHEKWVASKDQLKAQTEDYAVERRIDKLIDSVDDEAIREVYAFFNYDEKWKAYLGSSWRDKAEMILMMKHGKLPMSLRIGKYSFNTFLMPATEKVLTVEQVHAMHVEFMYKIEQYFRTVFHYPISVYVSWPDPSKGTFAEKRGKLDDLYAEAQKTNYILKFEFLWNY